MEIPSERAVFSIGAEMILHAVCLQCSGISSLIKLYNNNALKASKMKKTTRIRLGLGAGLFTALSGVSALGYNHLAHTYEQGICQPQADASAQAVNNQPRSLIQTDTPTPEEQACASNNIYVTLKDISVGGAIIGFAVAAGVLMPLMDDGPDNLPFGEDEGALPAPQ